MEGTAFYINGGGTRYVAGMTRFDYRATAPWRIGYLSKEPRSMGFDFLLGFGVWKLRVGVFGDMSALCFVVGLGVIGVV